MSKKPTDKASVPDTNDADADQVQNDRVDALEQQVAELKAVVDADHKIVTLLHDFYKSNRPA